MVALKCLTDNAALGLEIATGQDPSTVPVSWVHVSELQDPTEFLQGGELLLLTGVNLPRGKAAQSAYVRRLVRSGVAGLGFGVGVTRDSVPESLLSACLDHELPLVIIPREVPFLAVTRAMAHALAEEERTERELIYDTQRRLTARAVEADTLEPVLGELARTLQCWAILLDRSGGVVGNVGADARQTRERLAEQIDRLAQRPGAASLLAQDGDDEVWLQSLTVDRRRVGYLLLGRDQPFTSREREVVNLAIGLFVLAMNRDSAFDRDRQGLESAVFHILATGERDLISEAARNLWGELPEPPLTVTAVAGSRLAVQAARRALNGNAPGPTQRLAFAVVADHLVALSQATDELSLAKRILADGSEHPLRIGVSTPVGYEELHRGQHEATQAAAESAEGRLTRFADLPTASLLGLVEEPVARDFAASWLRPLQVGGPDLLTSLRVWLEHHGQWDPAASELGIHRHTLRNRVNKAEGLLGRRLDTAANRAELWLALQLDNADTRH